MDCPECQNKIKTEHILFALNPTAIKCKGCGVTLLGNTFIKLQIIVVLTLGGLIGLSVAKYGSGFESLDYLIIAALVVIVAAPNLWLTVKYGKYTAKQSEKSV